MDYGSCYAVCFICSLHINRPFVSVLSLLSRWWSSSNISLTMADMEEKYCISMTSYERDSVSNHQPHHCLLNSLFRGRSKKTSKLRVTGLCSGNSPATGEFPAQKASNAENVSIWWRHYASNISLSPWQTWKKSTEKYSAIVLFLK